MKTRSGALVHARRFVAVTVVGLTVMAATPLIARTANAVSRVVECNGSQDIQKVQAAVDASSDGDTVLLRGTCNFRDAVDHGGTKASISSTAVLVRPGTPVQNLTIASADAAQQASVVGAATQTAFAVAPGNDGFTIRGLRFTNFARPIVVLGADDVTIGAGGGTPNANANHIFGGLTQDSAILAVANSDTFTVSYGSLGAAGSVSITPGDLRNLVVEGNYVQYAPPGPGDPLGNADVVAVDVRQKGTAVAEGITIAHNAVGMFTSDFGSFSQNAIRVQSITASPASPVPAITDYRITDVHIVENNLGRLEEIDPGQLPEDVDAGDAHAGGRVGVVLHRVGGYEVRDNELRSRISITGPGSMPGGGILVADSGFGITTGNDIATLSDPGTVASRDAGAIGVFDGLGALFGDSNPDQASTENVVSDNQIGRLVPVRRGIVLSGTDKATVYDNVVRNSTDDALFVGASVEGPSGAMPLVVARSVACQNILGTNAVADLDRGDEVTYNGTVSSVGNAFPGGAASSPGNNSACKPTLAVSPAPPATITAIEPLVATGRAWASRDVRVTVTDDLGATVQKVVAGDGIGGYMTSFTATDLASLADGLVTVVATAVDPSGFELSSDPVGAILDLDSTSPDAGDVIIDDGGDGWSNSTEVLSGLPVFWTAPTNPVQTATVWFSDSSGTPPLEPSCGPFANQDKSGAIFLPVSCALALPQAEYRFNVRWTAADGSQTGVVFDSSLLDTRTTQPSIATPVESAGLTTSSVTFTGTAEPNSQVFVQTDEQVVLGSAFADGTGSWTATLSFDDGTHRVSAYSIDQARNRSTASPLRTFHVNTAGVDTTPPAPPEIDSPFNGSLHTAAVPFAGTAEPGSRVDIMYNGQVASSFFTTAGGAWGGTMTLPTGTYTMTAIAEDQAGNRSADSEPVTFSVDANPPELEIFTEEDSIHLLTEVVIDGRVRDNDSVLSVHVEYYDMNGQLVYPADPAACALPGCPTPANTWVEWTHNGNEPTVGGPRTFRPGIFYALAIATDRAGNVTKKAVRFVAVQP